MIRFAVAAMALVLAGGLSGQTFEVASVKPGDGHQGIDMKASSNRFLATNCSLHQLIEAAYSMARWQVTAGPAWLDSDRFDIDARTAEDLSADTDRVIAAGRPAPRKMMIMLQVLLADRFGVKVHRETREDNVYALVVAKGGPKLKTPADTTRSGVGTSRTGSIYESAVTVIVNGMNASMDQMAKYLEGNVGRPVANQTGIAGNFDFRIEYAPENSPAENVPSFFTALQDEAGLKLSVTKGPVEFLVVDRAEKPTAN